MAILHGLLLAATAYGWAALAAFLFLARTWRGVENGLRPGWVAAAWPAVLPALAAYYAAACLYTLGIVLNARRKAGPVVAGDVSLSADGNRLRASGAGSSSLSPLREREAPEGGRERGATVPRGAPGIDRSDLT